MTVATTVAVSLLLCAPATTIGGRLGSPSLHSFWQRTYPLRDEVYTSVFVDPTPRLISPGAKFEYGEAKPTLRDTSMKLTFVVLTVLFFVASAGAESPPIADGQFKGDLESLRQYQCPEWFRDAKFGIWAHWGPQSVPMEGDWYAKHMYVQGHPTVRAPSGHLRASVRARLQGDHPACGRPRSGTPTA